MLFVEVLSFQKYFKWLFTVRVVDLHHQRTYYLLVENTRNFQSIELKCDKKNKYMII